MKYYLLRIGLLVALGMCSVGRAVTLGEARVNSFLNQPLDAEISLIGLEPGQHEELRLRIANDEHFDRLGIVYDQFLADLRFDVVRAGAQWLVRARSTRPVIEPFLDFPLQMTWRGGQLIKQYTLLLDPPRRIQPARAASVSRQTTVATTQPAAPGPGDSRDSYGPVRNGETLWPIAQNLAPRGITTRQMAMALLRANPEAFIDGNVNNLRAGATLTIPPRAFIEELDAATARAEFAAQSKRWRTPAIATSPRALESAASTVPTEAPAATDDQPRTASSVPTEQAEPQAQLRILTEQKDAPSNAEIEQDLKDKLLVTMEEIESNRLTTGAIESRLARLENELERMQKLVELKDAQIAALQSEVADREAIQEAAREAEPGLPAAGIAPLPAGLQPAEPGGDSAGVAPVATPAPAPAAVTRVEPVVATPAPDTTRPWYEQYLWALWLVLALLGLLAVVLMFRRPQALSQDLPMADLAGLKEAERLRPAATDPAEQSALKQAEEDFRKLASAQSSATPEHPAAAAGLPELDVARSNKRSDEKDDDVNDSLLDEMLDESKLLSSRTESSAPEPEFSDDDIASWIKELGTEVERAEPRSANDEKLPANDDIPSILTELDDQLTATDTTARLQTPDIRLEPIDEPHEDDTFTMSLDLARAYLEIGDPEGARDMLKQALSSTSNPEHRRQIEELLQQID